MFYPGARRSTFVSLFASFSVIAVLIACATAAVAAGDLVPPLDTSGEKGLSDAPPSGPFIARVAYNDVEDLRALSAFDLLEFNDRDARYVLALVDTADFAAIRGLGFAVRVDLRRTEELLRGQRAVREGRGTSGIPGFPCYRTVEETFASATAMSVAHPTLAAWLDVGDSWERQQGLGGYDLRVLKLTNTAIAGPKPKLAVTAAIHAREYTTAELVTRFAESLLEGYGSDADATWLLDHHEIHLMLQTNPDGRKQAESGSLWRKNTNQNYCGATSSSRGADLNRNFEFEWGCCGGSSASACNETYRGVAPASEPEVQAVQQYLRTIFPDQREPALDAAAPDDATGVYVDVHSYSQLVLWPWGFGAALPPNSAALTTLGRKLAWFNGYTPQQAIELYPTDGTTDDFVYGDLGVAAYTFELGTSFFQSCAAFEGSILEDNLAALRFAAKVARTPYITPAGPDALAPLATPVLVDPGQSLTVTATFDDTRFNNTNGAEPTQTVAAAEMYVDVPPWSPGATALALGAVDGSFDEAVEQGSATLDTSALTAGRHLLFVRGRDAAGVWGAVSAAFFWIADGSEGQVAGHVTDNSDGTPLTATVGVPILGVATTTDAASGFWSLRLPSGSWQLTASAEGHLPQSADGVVVSSGVTTPLDFALQPVPPILLVDDDDNAPDVRVAYEQTLTALGESWYVWDTSNSDDEPDAETLASFDVVLWMTGDEYGGAAGPGAAAETALAGWLDRSRCLLVASQDYRYDRGVTAFMQQRLGVASATNDVGQITVTGQGSVFGGLGPWNLTFPYTNYTDTLVADATAEVGFAGNVGAAALDKDTALYRTSYWSFGLETLPDSAAREAVLGAFLDWCEGLELADGDGDGTVNGSDCAPADPSNWSAPSPAFGLIVRPSGPDELQWNAPVAPGSVEPLFDVLRSDSSPGEFGAAHCVEIGGSDLVATDGGVPGPGGLFSYLVRARNLCGETLGAGATATRSVAACH